MKKANVICCNTMLKGFYSVLDTLKPFCDDTNVDNIIIVPDNFSMNAERLMFEYLGIESSFNIHIVTLTRLVKKVLENKLTKEQILTKSSATLLITKILLDNKERFKTIKNSCSSQISETFYETIMQFKTSGIKCTELSSAKDNLTLQSKLEDIAFVYGQYQQQIENKLYDSADLLDLFANFFSSNQYYTSCRYFVSMFDSFSFKQMEILKTLALFANDFTISFSANTQQCNKNIYLNQTLQQVLQLFKKYNIEYDIKNTVKQLPGDFEFLSKNLFGFNNEKKNSDKNIMLVEAENIEQEITFVARKIKSLTVSNQYNFGDYIIACGDNEKYKDIIKNIFDEYDLPFYNDYQAPLDKHFYASFILNILNIFTSNFSKNYVLEYLNSVFCECEQSEFFNFECYVTKFGIDEELFLNDFYSQEINDIRKKYLRPLIVLKQSLSKSTTIYEYTKCLQDFLNNLKVKEKLEQMIINAETSVELKSSISIAINKVDDCFNLLQTILPNNQCSLDYFVAMISSLFSSNFISTVPLGVNKIFVGDLNKSSFYPSKVMFIVGACEGSVPFYKSDCGLITDKEIEMLNTKNLLNPSIRFVNKKSKYNLFETCLRAKEKLYVCYPTMMFGEAKMASEIFAAIKKCLLVDNNALSLYKISNEVSYIKAKQFGLGADKATWQFVMGSKLNAVGLALKNSGEIFDSIKSNYLKTANCQDNLIENAKSLFFSKDNFSISKLERYFTCPFMHFVEYGLKLKQKEKFGLENVDVGNFLHSVAEKFTSFYIDNNYVATQDDIKNIVDKVCKDELFDHECKIEKIRLDSLLQEAKRLCDSIITQTNSSQFKPKFIEQKFVSNDSYNGLKFVGKVDRIDTYNNYFVLFDYKTGKSDFSFSDIYYGNKIQILAYLDAIQNLYKLMPVGAFYIPVKNKFSSENQSSKCCGVFTNQLDLLKLLDNSLNSESKSEIYKISFNSDGQLNQFSTPYSLSPLELENVKQYVNQLIKTAIDDICNGEISPKPIKNSCEYCAYRLICKYNATEKGYRSQVKTIKKEFFTYKEAENE